MSPPAGGEDRAGTSQSRAIELISTVAHEIRSPLTSIKGFTRMLIDRWDRFSDAEKIEMLEAVDMDADRVTHILGDLLEASRLEAGAVPLAPTGFDLRALAREVVDEIGPRSDTHRVELLPGDEVPVRADQGKVRQVITNLVVNAITHTEAGDVEVTVGLAGDDARLGVTDSGTGLGPDEVGMLFSMFRGPHRATKGTGLGLYICKGLVEAHGGRIGVDSQPDAGSTFWFTIPGAAS